MKQLRHILSISLIALATMLLLAHNVVPHHHSSNNGLTACIDHPTPIQPSIEEAIVPCNAAAHSCSAASHQNEHFCDNSNHCNHSLCTLLYEFLSSSNANLVSHNQLATLILIQYIPLGEKLIAQQQNYSTPEQVPLNEQNFFRDTPRRAPPVA